MENLLSYITYYANPIQITFWLAIIVLPFLFVFLLIIQKDEKEEKCIKVTFIYGIGIIFYAITAIKNLSENPLYYNVLGYNISVFWPTPIIPFIFCTLGLFAGILFCRTKSHIYYTKKS